MPSALLDLPLQPAPDSPPRKRWTRAEYQSLSASGLFDQQHLELVEGELINKMGKNRPHVNALLFIRLWLEGVFGGRHVITESPIDVSAEDNPINEPEPDIIVLKQDPSNFRSANPGPADLHLVVEIADTSLNFDLTTKAHLYARAGIAEYWILNIQARRLIVHRKPEVGKYTAVLAYSEHEGVSPLAAPQASFRVGDGLLAS